MDLDDARRYLRANHRSVLIARQRDESPQPSPVVRCVDDEGRAL
jgi:hypothetical protein